MSHTGHEGVRLQEAEGVVTAVLAPWIVVTENFFRRLVPPISGEQALKHPVTAMSRVPRSIDYETRRRIEGDDQVVQPS